MTNPNFDVLYAQDLTTVRPPADLPVEIEELIAGLVKAIRFIHSAYPPTVVNNDSYEYTARMVLILQALNLFTGEDLQDGVLMAWLHDLEEGVAEFEYTLVATTQQPDLRKKKRAAELAFAKQYLNSTVLGTDRYWRLYGYYNAAGDLVRLLESGGMPNSTTVDRTAFLVKILDIVEGFCTLHRSLSRWAASDRYDASLMPPDDVLMIGLDKNRVMRQVLCRYDHPAAADAYQLLTATVQYVRQLWLERDCSNVPWCVREYFIEEA